MLGVPTRPHPAEVVGLQPIGDRADQQLVPPDVDPLTLRALPQFPITIRVDRTLPEPAARDGLVEDRTISEHVEDIPSSYRAGT
jgi:hypothetical protein